MLSETTVELPQIEQPYRAPSGRSKVASSDAGSRYQLHIASSTYATLQFQMAAVGRGRMGWKADIGETSLPDDR
jgi:hypothetical protein